MENGYIFDITYPDEDEIRAAQLACCGRVCKECEAPAAYAWRKREVDLALLLEKAIDNELTETEKSIVEDVWYNSLSFSQIARNRGINPSSVKRTSERALEKLERVLSYVVLYQKNVMDESVIPAAVGRARIIHSARKMKSDETGQRIRNLRLSQGLSLKILSTATGIIEKRIEEIENGEMPSTGELLIFSDYFGVTTDYILKGDNNV